MKKLLMTAATIALCALSLIGLTGCAGESSTEGESVTGLQYNAKYYHSNGLDRDEDEKVYFIFRNDGTCSFIFYSYYYNEYFNTTSIDHYQVNLKYTFIDKAKETVKCFFDSVEYFDDDNQKAVKNTRQYLLSVSQNVVIAQNSDGNTTFINENYLKEIPNFGVKTDA